MGAEGTLERDGDGFTVRFERTVAVPPGEAFAALVEPDLVERWLAPCELERVVGGRVHLTFPEGSGASRGVVTEYDEPRALEYTWNEGDGDDDASTSLLRFDVDEAPGGATLRLTHSQVRADEAAAMGAGWQSHLEALDASLSGAAWTRARIDERYEQLRADYDALVEA
jgi:uncharacterized protein YndB with AHSA1/START domain